MNISFPTHEIDLDRITHLGIGAHPDDLEIMSMHGISECYGSESEWFGGLVLTDGRSSARSGRFANLSDDDMVKVRYEEQLKAAALGKYGFIGQFQLKSQVVKSQSKDVIEELKTLFEKVQPKVVYTHNLADKHQTHVGVALMVIKALRMIPENKRPKAVYGCEVWRDLDWLSREDKIILPIGCDEKLEEALLQVYESQIAGGKRYDLATLGRRRANATYSEAHSVDAHRSVIHAMDLTPLINDVDLSPADFTKTLLVRAEKEILSHTEALLENP